MITGYEASSSLMISSLANSVIFSQPHKECYDDHHHHYDQNEDICDYHIMIMMMTMIIVMMMTMMIVMIMMMVMMMVMEMMIMMRYIL